MMLMRMCYCMVYVSGVGCGCADLGACGVVRVVGSAAVQPKGLRRACRPKTDTDRESKVPITNGQIRPVRQVTARLPLYTGWSMPLPLPHLPMTLYLHRMPPHLRNAPSLPTDDPISAGQLGDEVGGHDGDGHGHGVPVAQRVGHVDAEVVRPEGPKRGGRAESGERDAGMLFVQVLSRQFSPSSPPPPFLE